MKLDVIKGEVRTLGFKQKKAVVACNEVHRFYRFSIRNHHDNLVQF